MNKLKNRGINAGFITAATIVILAVIISFFNPGTSIEKAPLLNKFLGVILFTAGGIWGWKSGTWFDDIENDRVHLWVQIGGVIFFFILAILVLAVWHSGPLGTTTNPI